MGDKGSFWLPGGFSSIASDVDALFYFVLWASTIIFIGVMAAMIYFVVKYRRRSASEVPQPVHESKLVELASIVLPTILTMIVFTWGFQVFIQMNTPPPNAYEVTVRAKQWFWEFEYPDGTTSANVMHVPTGIPVKLIMSSEDVIHSMFIPAFRVKHDVLPNRYTSVWFEATDAGEYQIYCTEYCGTSHSGMLGTVVAESQQEFDAWLVAQNQDLPPVELGLQVFMQYNCKVCHSIDGSRVVGPSLLGLFGSERVLEDGTTVTADDNYIRESILNPAARVVQTYPNAMPATYSTFTAKQLDGVIAYIKTLQ